MSQQRFSRALCNFENVITGMWFLSACKLCKALKVEINAI